MKRRNLRNNILNGKKKPEGLLIYMCLDCGIIEYLEGVTKGGKCCPDCGYIMENEEP